MELEIEGKCIICWEEIGANDGLQCQTPDCENMLCYNCLCEDSYPLTDKIDVDMLCSVCGNLVCPFCVRLCYDCATEERNFEIFCDECMPSRIVYSDCEYHTWSTCGKHDFVEKCGICRKRRYDAYDLLYNI